MTYFILFFIKSYLSIFIATGMASLFIFLSGLYIIYKIHFKNTSYAQLSSKNYIDVSMIAGDNLQATQLDLARAYIEIGKNDLAKQILTGVATQGSIAQKNEARILLGLI